MNDRIMWFYRFSCIEKTMYYSCMKHHTFLATLALFIITSLSSQLLAEKNVLITGANRGLGLEFAKQYKAAGYTVYGTARKPEKAKELKEAGVTVLQLDVTDAESITAMAKKLEGKPIDILINNAGYFGPKLMTEKMDNLKTLTPQEMETCFKVNTMGPLFVTQALLPNLNLSKQPFKKVINISTRASILKNGVGGYAVGYRTSKAALNMATKSMAATLRKEKYIVISLAPGHNKTDMGTTRANLNPKDSIAKIITLIDGLKPEQTGRFWFYTGKELPW